MLIKTHVAITLFFILLLISAVESKILFVIIALLATFIADVDFQFSKLGKYKISRLLQFFVKHRGFIHSFTFLVLISLFFVLFLPVVALPFFLGYGSHLLADSFTVRGIRAFWPSKKVASWKVKTGSKLEMAVFIFFIIADLILFFINILGVV